MSTKNLFYIHGLSSNKDNNPILKEVCFEKNYNFYAINLPGHADQEFNDIELSIEGYGEFIKKYIIDNQINNNLVIYGHSMGGSIAAYLASQYKTQLDIRHIILEDPLNISSERNIKNFDLDGITRRLDEIKTFNDSNKQFGTNTHLLSWFKKLKSRIPSHKLIDYMTLIKNISSNDSLNNLDVYYKNLSIKTDIIFGKNDFIIKTFESLQYFNQINSNIKTYVIDDAAHSPYKENPLKYMEILKKLLY